MERNNKGQFVKGCKMSEKEKKNLRKVAKPPSRKGCKMSESAKIKIGNARKGKKHTKATKIKIGKTKLGKRNPNWNGGVTTEIMKIRNSIDFSGSRI